MPSAVLRGMTKGTLYNPDSCKYNRKIINVTKRKINENKSRNVENICSKFSQ